MQCKKVVLHCSELLWINRDSEEGAWPRGDCGGKDPRFLDGAGDVGLEISDLCAISDIEYVITLPYLYVLNQ
ncbi:Uncharacterised protein [Chlamydia trachomatis]|nr:Uncharacterised protein [Chlamydia trachomatis]